MIKFYPYFSNFIIYLFNQQQQKRNLKKISIFYYFFILEKFFLLHYLISLKHNKQKKLYNLTKINYQKKIFIYLYIYLFIYSTHLH
jgi:hypothetical protein